jgi:hypothetical protein
MNALFKLTLKSTAIGAIAFFAVASGCSSNTEDDTGAGGDSSTSGGSSSTTAGKSGTAGAKDNTGGDPSTTGGAPSGTAGASLGGESSGGGAIESNQGGGPDLIFGQGGDGAGGAGTGPAVGKFCNTLEKGGKPITLRLEIGEGAEMVTFTAKTGQCAPADGKACTPLPLGTDVLIQMFDNSAPTVVIDAGTADILPGEDWILFTDLDETGATPQPIFDGGVVTSVACEDVVYDDI